MKHELDQDQQTLMDERGLHNKRKWNGGKTVQVHALPKGSTAGDSGLGGRAEKNVRGEGV